MHASHFASWFPLLDSSDFYEGGKIKILEKRTESVKLNKRMYVKFDIRQRRQRRGLG
jgi:hypothetical protein